MPSLLRLYAVFREPKVFLTVLCGFITMSLTAHVMRAYDADLGLTNLILSMEASIYGVVSSMMVKGVSRKQDEMAEMQRKQLDALLSMAESQREMTIEHGTHLRAIRDIEERRLKTLTAREE
jgi:hypothetical protein